MNADQKELAACYTRCFGSEDGRRVYDDLKRKFGGQRPRYGDLLRWIASGAKVQQPRPCNVTATLIEGQASVIAEIDDAIAAGKHSE
jgi:hypothetical protein